MSSVEKKSTILVLDNIRSAHNVGSIFRTADAFAISKLYLCGLTPVPPKREIRKTALGAEQVVEWEHVPSTLSAIELLQEQGYSVIGIEQTTDACSMASFQRDTIGFKRAFVFGHELWGVSEAALDRLDTTLFIPQWGVKKSLNVATCVGIVAWHFCAAV